jgi:hypothetical protein
MLTLFKSFELIDNRYLAEKETESNKNQKPSP